MNQQNSLFLLKYYLHMNITQAQREALDVVKDMIDKSNTSTPEYGTKIMALIFGILNIDYIHTIEDNSDNTQPFTPGITYPTIPFTPGTLYPAPPFTPGITYPTTPTFPIQDYPILYQNHYKPTWETCNSINLNNECRSTNRIQE